LATPETFGAVSLAKWHQWEPASGDGAREGAKLAFGRNLNTVYMPGKANVILSLDSDFLASGPGHIAYAKQYARRRKLDGPNDTLNRLYVVEPTPTVTGSSADHRLPLRAGDIELFARALAGKLGLSSPVPLSGEAAKWLERWPRIYKKNVVHRWWSPANTTGSRPCARARHQRVSRQCRYNLYYTEPVEAESTGNLESLRELCGRHGRRQS